MKKLFVGIILVSGLLLGMLVVSVSLIDYTKIYKEFAENIKLDISGVEESDFKIKKSKLRGVESFGMLCSEKEMGLADQADGLMELPDDARSEERRVGKECRSRWSQKTYTEK